MGTRTSVWIRSEEDEPSEEALKKFEEIEKEREVLSALAKKLKEIVDSYNDGGNRDCELAQEKPAEIDEYKIIKKHITEDAISSEVNKRLRECEWYVTDKKPAEWSEEDKRLLRTTLECLNYVSCQSKTPVVNWLKSLPERFNLQPKQELSEDERMRKHIIDIIKDNAKSKCIPCDAEIAYLEKQKEQKPEEKPINWTELTWKDVVELEGIINNVHYEFRNCIGQESFGKEVLERFREYKGDEYLDEIEQKPAEWGEEDEKMLKDTIRAIHLAYPYALDDENPRKKNIDWLKDLKERFNFHPKQEWSEEDELEKEIKRYQKHYILVKERGYSLDWMDIETTARHFYELGLKARKEETK